jgi:MoxR-like ATPase
MATREPADWGLPELAGRVALGASPRATLGLIAAARGYALVQGRTYVVPRDVFEVAPEVLRHRLLLSYDALAEGVQVDDVVGRVLGTVPPPRVANNDVSGPPTQHDDTRPVTAVAPAGPYGMSA